MSSVAALRSVSPTLTSIIPPEARYIRNFALLLSSTMATASSRDNPYYHVRDLAVKLLRHPTLYLNSDDLAAAGIEVAAMDIKTGTPADSGPQFCDLYPRR